MINPAPSSLPPNNDNEEEYVTVEHEQNSQRQRQHRHLDVVDDDDLPPPPPTTMTTTEAQHLRNTTTTTTNRKEAPPSPPLVVLEKTALTGKEGACFIDVTTVEWMWESPWKSFKQKSCSGTGFILDSGKIMTCSHVVKYAIDVRVRRHGSARKFLAKVLTYAPDVDLALLEIVDENVADFFGPERPLRGAAVFSTEIPALQTRVTVCGYPTGGSTICLTEGVVSRVDDVTIAGCQDSLLMIQIDAAINSGNSGGPCYGPNGNVVGIAFAKSASGNDDNIGYILSAPIAVAFLGRVGEDGSYTIIPSVPYTWRKLENKSLRLAHIVPSHVHGVLLTSVCPSTQEWRRDWTRPIRRVCITRTW